MEQNVNAIIFGIRNDDEKVKVKKKYTGEKRKKKHLKKNGARN